MELFVYKLCSALHILHVSRVSNVNTGEQVFIDWISPHFVVYFLVVSIHGFTEISWTRSDNGFVNRSDILTMTFLDANQ